MNKENLQKMADYIKTIPQNMFDMNTYRDGQTHLPECDSVGCILGHCTILDDKIDNKGYINFSQWGEKFTGIDENDSEWDWCFHSLWASSDNTPLGASKRIEWLIKHGLPYDWREQMWGEEPLRYN